MVQIGRSSGMRAHVARTMPHARMVSASPPQARARRRCGCAVDASARGARRGARHGGARKRSLLNHAVGEGPAGTSDAPDAAALQREIVALREELSALRGRGDAEARGLGDGDSGGDVSVPASSTITTEAFVRGRWLCALLILQSSSGAVLQGFESLIEDHIVITFFLTMLVGAGGNCGNQSAISVIRSLAVGDLDLSGDAFRRTMSRQARVGVLLALATTSVGVARVLVTDGELQNVLGISASLFAIVFTSTLLGAALPFGLGRFGVDPANAGTTIQVVMDVLGVATTCAVCSLVYSYT